MPEIPEYVGYANDLVEKLGERLERTLREAVAEMATKSDLALVEERAQRDREDLGKLRTEIKADKEAAAARGRRIWRAIWSVLGVLIATFGTTLLSLFLNHY